MENKQIELRESDMLEIEIIVDGLAVCGMRFPMMKALKIAADLMHSEKPKLHHSQKFEIKIKIDNG